MKKIVEADRRRQKLTQDRRWSKTDDDWRRHGTKAAQDKTRGKTRKETEEKLTCERKSFSQAWWSWLLEQRRIWFEHQQEETYIEHQKVK